MTAYSLNCCLKSGVHYMAADDVDGELFECGVAGAGNALAALGVGNFTQRNHFVFTGCRQRCGKVQVLAGEILVDKEYFQKIVFINK